MSSTTRRAATAAATVLLSLPLSLPLTLSTPAVAGAAAVTYEFVSVSRAQCLDNVREVWPTVLMDCDGSPQQRWTLAANPADARESRIVNVDSGRCLAGYPDGSVRNDRCHGDRDQQWTITPSPDQGWVVAHGGTGAYLAAGLPGSEVRLAPRPRGAHTEWLLVRR